MSFNAITYFRDVATRMKAIGHTPGSPRFFRASNVMQLQELLQSLAVASYPALVIFDKRDGRFEDQNSNNLVDRQYYQLLILKPAGIEDSDQRQQAIDECFAIIRRIISRMTRDWLTANRGLPDVHGLRNLDRGSMYYNSIGPLVDNLFGMELVFTLREPVDTKFNADDWADD